MKKNIKSGRKKWILTAAAVFVLILVGFFVWRQSAAWRGGMDGTQPKTFLERVDRGMSDADRAVFEAQLKDLQDKLAKSQQEGKRDVNLLLRLGNAYYTLGALKLASDQYRDILSSNPTDAAALENLGQARLEMQDYFGAEESWIRAIDSSPYELTYYRLVDLIKEYIPEHQTRIKDILENAVANLGQTYGLMLRLGDWYAAQGQYDRAVSHYEVALQLEPGDLYAKEKIEEYRRKALEQQLQGN